MKLNIDVIVFLIVVTLACIVGCTGCQTVIPTIDSGSVIETQTDVIIGGQTVETQAHEIVTLVKDPALIAKAKTLEASAVKLNADIKTANAAIVDYIKAAEKASKVMFKLAIDVEKLKGQRNLYLSILVALAVIAGLCALMKFKKWLPF
jgi:hypothetical protein